LYSATDVVARWRGEGGHAEGAIRWTLRQLDALRCEVEDEARWQRLVLLVVKTGDVWNAEDWPYGFDPLLVCAPLCANVRFECERCPVGRRQSAMSCAHPQTMFGRIGEHVRRGERELLLAHLRSIEGALAGEHDAR
jgi:hypothetical protein